MNLDSSSANDTNTTARANSNGDEPGDDEIPTIQISGDEFEQDDSDEDEENWEIESIFEDLLGEMDDQQLDGGKYL